MKKEIDLQDNTFALATTTANIDWNEAVGESESETRMRACAAVLRVLAETLSAEGAVS